MSARDLANPILNGPYDIPSRHFVMGPKGPTGDIRDGRRPSESFVPIAGAVKGADDSLQGMLELEGTTERRELNSLINSIRHDVDLWRSQNYPRATAISRKLMLHWAAEHRENRVLFCQREAAETAVYLHEVAGREDFRDYRPQLDAHNVQYNDGLPRTALKMATGSGKTVVMAMLIAWQALNKVASPRDRRFVKRFLVIAPGITIRDRLQVLQPSHAGNYYDERDLVPPDLRQQLSQAVVAVTNYHAFLHRDSKEIKGVAANTRKLLLAGREDDPFRETDEMMVQRVLRDLGSHPGEIAVLNDEAHHCYRDRPVTTAKGKVEKLDAEAKQANEDARVWFKGLQAIEKHVGLKAVWDLSATPYYLKGSGYHEGFIFPWTVSDFSLMDAIESGIVKVPRLPVDDDAAGDEVVYRELWESIGPELGKRTLANRTIDSWVPPARLEGALRSLYRNYEKSFRAWEETLAARGEPPPVFIVVCPNTAASKLVHEWISGYEVQREAGIEFVDGKLPLLSNGVDGEAAARPPTILVDSAQLESGELKADFKAAVAGEIDAFQAEYRRRNPGADVDKISDADLLREVLNTVGKKGRLGEHVRCVVSVAMLTEGWDANTVTHVLGVRAFRSQLLCEQVVGRGLRRRSYALGEDGRFAPEYANVYGIPFAFIPSEHETGPVAPPPPAVLVETLDERSDLRIEFPILDGYRTEIPDERLELDPDDASRLVVGRDSVPRWVQLAGIAGEKDEVRDSNAAARQQEVAFQLASRLLKTHFTDGESERAWMFPRLLEVTRLWLAECVEVEEGYSIGRLLLAEAQAEASEKLYHSIVRYSDQSTPRLRAMLRPGEHLGSTDDISFLTRKAVHETLTSPVSHVVLDGKGGNTWEQLMADECELSTDVVSYVKNDHLGFAVPYVHKGQSHSYLPDFILRLARREGDLQRYLVVEVSGGQKSPGPTTEKAQTMLNRWCPAVNNHGGFGRWGYVEITTMLGVREALADAIRSVYDDGAAIGDQQVMDYQRTRTSEVLGGLR